jgi:protein-disulfide isomerase
MTSLNWQDAPQKNTAAQSHAAPSKGLIGFAVSVMSGAAFSLFLMGLIGGYVIGKVTNGGLVAAPTAQVVAQAPTPTPTATAPTPAVAGPVPEVDAKTDHIRGNPNAKISLISYSDFECPFCKKFKPTTDQVLAAYGDKVNFVYRHFPLSFHQNAQKEAEASECVAELGGNDAFWKFHDYIFDKTTSNGTGFALDQLPVAAKASGVNEAKFKTCLDSGKYAQLVAKDEADGQAAGVNGTPGNILLNNDTKKSQLISGAQPFSNFQSAIDAILQ